MTSSLHHPSPHIHIHTYIEGSLKTAAPQHRSNGEQSKEVERSKHSSPSEEATILKVDDHHQLRHKQRELEDTGHYHGRKQLLVLRIPSAWGGGNGYNVTIGLTPYTAPQLIESLFINLLVLKMCVLIQAYISVYY